MKRWTVAAVRVVGVTLLTGMFLVYPLWIMAGEDSHTKQKIGVTTTSIVTPTAEDSHTNAGGVVTPTKGAAVSALRALNVRAGNGVTFGVAGYLWAGEVVEVIGECVNGWTRIRAGDLRGWVNADYLTGEICP